MISALLIFVNQGSDSRPDSYPGLTMEQKIIWRERLLYLFIGVFITIGIVLLSGAATNTSVPLKYGRFQLETWATRFDDKSAGMGAFVVDTATGETKTVYSRIYGDPPEAKVINKLNMPFYVNN